MKKFDLEYFIARRIASAEGGKRNNVMVKVATLSVAIGIAVMIVSLAVIVGFKKEISGKLSGFGSDVQITHFDRGTSFETVPIDQRLVPVDRISQLKGFAGAHPYAIKAGIVRGEEAFQVIVLKGVGAGYDWSFFEKNLVEGSLPEMGEVRKKEILISRTLAQAMNLEVGQPVRMTFISDPPREDRFRISGIYDSGFGQMDDVMVMGDIRDLRRLNNWDSEQVTGIDILTDDFSALDRFTEKVRGIVESEERYEYDLKVANVKERYPTIFDWLKAHNVNAAVIITVMLLVALFNMMAALLIILLERTPMIGVLKALGMGNRSLQKMFIIRSSFVILKGMFWGNVLGIGLSLLQHFTGLISLNSEGYYLSAVPIYIDWWWLLGLNGATFLFIVALLTLPTMIISLILPEKSIRFE